MQIREISKPVTSKALNESLAKKFGYKLNLEQFTDVQLEDVRNRLRTEVSQFEVNESYDALHENPKYQKTRALLDVINQAIMEREEAPEEAEEPKAKQKVKKVDPKKAIKEARSQQIYFASVRKKAEDYSVPEGWIKSAINRMQLGESDQEELSSELVTRYDLHENVANYIVYLNEGEEEKAKVIMATKDMVDQITGWLEDTAALKAEQLLELMDSIRETLGSDVASKYEQAVKPALEGVYTALESSRQGLSAGLALVSGGEAPMMGSAPMGGAPDMGAEAPMGGAPEEAAPEEAAPEEELGAVAGGAPGREKRESVDYSRRLGMLLNSKKK